MDIIQFKKELSEKRMGELILKIGSIEELQSIENVCVYVTGSYARKEASIHSDLDLFFINYDKESPQNISRLSKTLIDAELIKITRAMDFPDFSGDGKYLEVHSLQEIMSKLGSSEDDYRNCFTARVLLLLESFPLHNRSVYERVVSEIVNIYYQDFHDHEKNFSPIFLVNDIIRFWRTLLLNYEHKRNRPSDNERRKVKAHIKNLKLKFSRKLTCYSFLISLLAHQGTFSPDTITTLVKLTPMDRLNFIGRQNKTLKIPIMDAINRYAWFLELTNSSTEELEEWMANRNNRDSAFEKSREFDMLLYEIMIGADNNKLLKYFII